MSNYYVQAIVDTSNPADPMIMGYGLYRISDDSKVYQTGSEEDINLFKEILDSVDVQFADHETRITALEP